ncbi:S41 family peptidase [Flavobacteriaceae bacterium]|jgi:carboxyl-terminal processing protease|nr:S41 family peptidase [Flavobacteriaceae bacterium]MDA7724046.1 S41 family peptidase [Flavobacteriaceae bacterium]MDA7727582.1 S41 family peptidase [Flavobacteriaceae bacterium]MDB0003853.1 S41 family peptidase [Flavobacteriaceae bacterium]
MNFSLKKRGILLGIIALVFISTTAYKNDYFEIAKQLDIFTTLFKEVNMNYVDETNPADLMQESVNQMLKELDPYTTYMNEQDVERARMYQSGAYVGIGATINTSENKLVVVEVYKDLPADKVGLKSGDEIIKIDGLAVSDLKESATQFLNGKKNTKVSLTYLRDDKATDIVVSRGDVKPKAVPVSKLLSNGIGYIALDRFTKTASKEVEGALKLMLIDEAKGVVLDLRNNPGGLLHEAVKIVNLFVPKGQLVVSTKSNVETYNQTFETQKQPLSLEIPLVVLINQNSASASEIVAGALQDLDRAVIVGKRSFGKGLVQRPKPLPYGSQLKVTISRYYTPSGRCIQALDYRNRKKDGSAVRYDKNQYTAFKTTNGRTVYDGGGIEPDIIVGKEKPNKFIEKLLKSSLVFDYSNQYFHNNTVGDMESFRLDKKDFERFKKMSLDKKYSNISDAQEAIDQLKNTLSEEGFRAMERGLEDLEASVQTTKMELIEAFKNDINATLEGEIIKRYFYREGMYTYFLATNNEVFKAQEIINDSELYKNILR